MNTKTAPVIKIVGNAAHRVRPSTQLSWLFTLQIEQRIHDDRHHPDVSRLSLHHRLNHLALHFAKYAGRIADTIRSGDHRKVNQTLIDTFIIALSAANVLNIRLDGQLDGPWAAGESMPNSLGLTDLLLDMTSASGKLARACEAVDHLEARMLRDEMSSAIVTLAKIAVTQMAARNLDIVGSVHARLAQVRQTKFFDGTY